MAAATTTTITVLLFLLTITSAMAARLELRKSHLHFYFQGRFSGPNATLVTVGRATPNATAFEFGSLSVLDDQLTELPDPASTQVGRCQGIISDAQLGNSPAPSTVENFIFTSGKYNGSSLAVVGRLEPASPAGFEMSVIGGTGQFRLAWGYALVKPLDVNLTKGQSVIEYNVYILHL